MADTSLAGPIATTENALPVTRSDADRKEALLVDTFKTDPKMAQVMLDRRNQYEGMVEAMTRDGEGDPNLPPTLDEVTPLPPTPEPAPIESKEMANIRANLERVEGGRELMRHWGSDLESNISHGFAGLEKLRAELPMLSDMVDRMPAHLQNSLAPQFLKFAAQYNRAHAGFMGERTGPAPSYSAPAAPPPYTGAPMTSSGGGNVSIDIQIERLNAEKFGLMQAGRHMEAQEADRKVQALFRRKLGRDADKPATVARAFGRAP